MIFPVFILVLSIAAAIYMYKKFEGQTDILKQNVILIGLPGAGKTVYFCVSMDVLQRKCNDLDKSFGVIFEEQKTERMVRNTVDILLRNQRWPENTSGSETHGVSISVKGKKLTLIYKDYSGEAFMHAFGEPSLLKIEQTETPEDNNPDTIFVKELLEDVASSNGIILVLDASLILDVVNMELSACLFNLLTQIKKSNFSGKLALVFAKGDLLHELKGVSVEEAFKKQQPNSFARLREIGQYNLFLVSAVNCVVNDDGASVPPLDYSSMEDSENVLAPLCWLLGLEETIFKKTVQEEEKV